MANLTRTEIVDVLNELLTDDLVDEYLFKRHVTLAMMRDASHYDFTGRYVHVPVQYKRGGGRSPVLATAQTNRTASGYDAFDVTLVSNYGTVGVDGMAMDLAKHGASEGMFINHLDQESKSGFEKMGDDLAHNLFRNSGGARGRITFSGTTATMVTLSDIRFIEIGDVIEASTADGTSGSVRSGTHTVTEVDRDAGTYEFSGTITGLTNNDYVFIEDDFGAKASGLDAWCPSSAPGATTHFGVNRSVAPVELGGMRFQNGTSYSPSELFIRIAQRMSRDNVEHDMYVCHPDFFGDVATALQSTRQCRDVDIESEYNGIGFKGLAVSISGVGEKVLVQDADCQQSVLWGLNFDNLGWYTLGDAPRKITEDGLEWMRGATTDDYECRLVARHQFLTPAPWSIMRSAVTATEV